MHSRHAAPRKVWALVTAAAAVVALAGCSNATKDTGNNGNANNLRIAFLVSKSDENTNAFAKSMQERAKVVDKKENVNITLDVYDAQGSVDTQITEMQQAATKKANVIILDPIDAKGMGPAVQAAHDAGIKVINFRPATGDPKIFDAEIGAPEEAYAANVKKWVHGLLDAQPSLTLNVGLIYGGQAQTAQLLRCDVYKQLAGELPGRVKIVAQTFGNWQTDVAQNAATDFMLAHPEMNLVVAANDAMAQGVANAVLEAHKKDKIMIASYDMTASLLQNVLAGKIDYATGNDHYDFAQTVDVALEVHRGTFDGSFIPEPIYQVTKANAANVLKIVQSHS